MDIDGLQDTRPEIHEFVRHVGRPVNDVALLRLEFAIPDSELRAAGLEDEDLIVGMHVPPRAHAHFLV